jgi:hypothetical protein
MQSFGTSASAPFAQVYQLPTTLSPLSLSHSFDLSQNIHASAIIAAQIKQVRCANGTAARLLAFLCTRYAFLIPLFQLQQQSSTSTMLPIAKQPLPFVVSPQPPSIASISANPSAAAAPHRSLVQHSSGSLPVEPQRGRCNTDFEEHDDAQVCMQAKFITQK